ncbi:hypothetical protein CL655_00775 [bacterium]|nr:hypothetical protein [bacterium]|tara:strand:- start:8269 stop:8637 length:369 start_codon:yes stop_codon:yes gene_type:complete
MSLENPSFFDTGDLAEPKLEMRDLLQLKAELKHAGVTGDISIDGTLVEIASIDVTSCFKIDMATATATLDHDKSVEIDLFGGDVGTHQTVRPLQSAEQIHKERLDKLNRALDAIADPQLIED